jgi:rhodanese-related sulfurtransferase
VAQKLLELGFKKVLVLKGGWNAWQEGKFPVEAK